MEKEIKIKNFPNLRTVYISSVIDGCSLNDFKKDLNLLIKADEEIFSDNVRNLMEIDKSLADAYKKNVKYPTITVDISSPGGSVYAAMAMYDIIKSYNKKGIHKINAKLSGTVASAASFIMLACPIRESEEHTSFLVHSISSFSGGKIEDVKDDLEEMNRMSDMVKRIYVDNTKLTLEKLEEVDKLKKDWWITAQEALDLGLITEIV